MLCGFLPFDDNDTQVLYKKIMKGEYQIPSHVSVKGRDLIKRVLNTDPSKRYSIQQIKNHPWFNLYKGYINISKGLIVGYNQIPVDSMIVEHVENFGYKKEVILHSLSENRHNKVTTLYYLLLQKFTRNGHISNADISSIFFKPKLLESFRAKIQKANKRPKTEDVSPPPSNKRLQIRNQDVNQILNRVHKNIVKKSKKPNIKKLDDTTMLSYEKNIGEARRKSVNKRRANNIIYQTTKVRRNRPRNKTQILNKKMKKKLVNESMSISKRNQHYNSSNQGIPLTGKSHILYNQNRKSV